MRNGRIDRPAGDTAPARGRVGLWVAAIAAICALWLVAMVVISYYGLEYKTPTRIDNWKPQPDPNRH